MRNRSLTRDFALLIPLVFAALPHAVAGPPETVTFLAADGVRITADYYAPPPGSSHDAPFVILLHMYRSDRTAWAPLAPGLQERGFGVLAMDLRGHGDSATTETRDAVARRDHQIFRDMQHDLRGAYDWLARQPRLDRARFALVGASVGCSIALQYAARDRSVDAVVCLSPGIDYLGLDSVGDIRQVTGRQVLMLATEDERDAPYTLQKACPDAVVEVCQGPPAHGTQLFGAVPNVATRIAEFLRRAVGEPTRTAVVGSIEKQIYHQPDSGWAAEISATNLRYYSSPAEAEARGLRAAKSSGPPRKSGTRETEPAGGRARGADRAERIRCCHH